MKEIQELFNAIYLNDIKKAEEAIGKVKDINCLMAGATPLHYAAHRGHVDMCRLLLDHGADMKALDSNGRNAMQQAALEGMGAVCKLFIDRGEDVNMLLPFVSREQAEKLVNELAEAVRKEKNDSRQ